MTKPTFSIVTVTLNNFEGLKATGNSLKKQTSEDYEWVVIDGGSVDETLDYLKQTNNAKWTSEADKGLYDAMNKGIAQAQGQYIWFMNAGDIFPQHHTINNISKAVKKQAANFIYGDAIENNRYKKSRCYTKKQWGMFTHHQSMIYKTSSFKKIHYNTKYLIAADYDLTYRFLNQTNDALYINEPFCIFEQGGISQNNNIIGRKEQLHIKINYGENKIYSWYIYCIQIISFMMKASLPPLYYFLKRQKHIHNIDNETLQIQTHENHLKSPV